MSESQLLILLFLIGLIFLFGLIMHAVKDGPKVIGWMVSANESTSVFVRPVLEVKDVGPAFAGYDSDGDFGTYFKPFWDFVPLSRSCRNERDALKVCKIRKIEYSKTISAFKSAHRHLDIRTEDGSPLSASFLDSKTYELWESWKARAALERK